MHRKSEVKFVEWSKKTHLTGYDVETVVDFLKQKNKIHLRGLDVGGGCGAFAKAIIEKSKLNLVIDVVDPSSLAKKNFIYTGGVNLIEKDFFHFGSEHKYDFIILKLVLHHVIDIDEQSTVFLQQNFVKKAADLLSDDGALFLEENFYEGWFNSDITGKLIFFFTKLKFIESLVRFLGANTAGEGVRFRSSKAWAGIFSEFGFKMLIKNTHPTWGGRFPIIQRLVLMCNHRYQAILVFKK